MRYFTQSLFRRAGVILCALGCWSSLNSVQAQTTFFTQDFSSSVAVNSYVSGTATANQFSHISSPSNLNTPVTIDASRGLTFRKLTTGLPGTDAAVRANRGVLVRNFNDWSGPPTALMISFDLRVQGQGTTNSTISEGVIFSVGDSYTNDTASENANAHSRFALSWQSGVNGGFRLRRFESAANTDGTDRTGVNRIWWFINNSGATLTYSGPNGATSTLNNDSWAVWVGRNDSTAVPVVVHNNTAAFNAAKDLRNFKMLLKHPMANGSTAIDTWVSLDNFRIESIATPITSTTGGTFTVGVNRQTPSLSGAGGAFQVLNASTLTSPCTVNVQTNIWDPGNNGTAAQQLGNNASFTSTNNVLITNTTPSTQYTIRSSSAGGTTFLQATHNINGADFVTIDGGITNLQTESATGWTNSRLHFRNTNTANNSRIFAIANDSKFFTLRGCYLSHAPVNNNQDGDLMRIGRGTTDGNDNLTIINNFMINDAGGGRSSFVEFADPGAPNNVGLNDDALVQRNNFVNPGNVNGNAATVITCTGTGNNFVIRDNSFYLNQAITPIGNTTVFGIQPVATAIGQQILNNYFGGTGPKCTGSAMTTNVNSGGFFRFMPLRMDGLNQTATITISGNQFANLDFNEGFNNCDEQTFTNWIMTGDVTFQNNDFGVLAPMKFTRTHNSGGGGARGLDFINAATGSIRNTRLLIKDNNFKNIEINTTGTISGFTRTGVRFYAIRLGTNGGAATDNFIVEGNTVENVQVNNAGTAGFFQMYGIECGTNSNGNVIIRNNTIKNMLTKSTATTFNTQGGNPCSGGSFDILSTMRGIRISSADTTKVQVYGNTVTDLRTTLGTDTVVGIDHWVTVAASGTIPLTSPYFGGLREYHHFYNNIVDLSTSTSGSVFGYRQRFPSTYLTTTAQTYFDHNTVNVGGTVSSGGNSAAFRRELNASPIIMRNNILQNVRTGGSGTHYVYDINSASGFTSGNNIVYSLGKTGVLGGTDANTFANWQTLSSQDASGPPGSKSDKQTFDGNYNVTSCNLLADVVTSISTPITITTDKAGTSRTPNNSPGAIIYLSGGTPTSVTWNGSVSSDWNNANNWCGLTVPTSSISAVINNDQTPPNWPNVTSGTINAKNLIISDIANLTLGAGVTINVFGDLTKSGTGTLTSTAADINLAGSATANISGISVDKLNVTGTGVKSLSGAITVDKLTINTGATLAINGQTLTVTELLNNSGTLQGGATSNFVYSGLDAGTVNANFSQINNLTMQNTGSGSILEINAPVTIFGDLTVSSGTVDGNGNNLTVRGNLVGSGTGVLTAGSAGTVTFDGVGTQTISGSHTFNNLTVSRVAAGTLTINTGASATAAGTVNIATASATLNVQGSLSYGNLTNSGTLTIPATANLGITGTGSWPGSPVISTINNLTIGSPNVTIPNNLTVNGALNLETGGVFNISGRTIALNGNINANGGVIKGTSGTSLTVGASGTVSGDVAFGPNPADRTLGATTINKAFSLGSNLTISGAATFGSTFAINSNTLTINSTSSGLGNLSASSSSVIGFGTSAGAVTFPNSITSLGGLSINNSAGVTLDGNLSVADLTLTAGKLNVPAGNKLTYTGTDAPARTTGYVALPENAEFEWVIPSGASGALNFPVGPEAVNGVTGYRPYTINGTVASSTTVKVSFEPNIAANPTSATNVSGTGNKRANFIWKVNSTANLTGIGMDATSAAADFNATPVVADLAIFRGQLPPWQRIGGTSAGYTVSVLSSTLNSGTNYILLGEGGGVDLPAGALAGLYIWTGAISTNWSTGGNWDQGTVPNASVHSVTIGNQVRKPVINSGIIDVNNVNILSGGSITVNSGATLVISGTFTNNGSFTGSQGSSVTFSGSVAQTINGTTAFHNVTVNKSVNPLTLGSAGTSISGNLTLNGSSVFNLAGNHLRLKALASNVNGQISTLTTPANLQNSTNVTVERKLPQNLFTNNTGGSVMVGSPVAGKTLNDYNTFNSLSLMGANGTSSVWYYDPFGIAPPEPQAFGWVRPSSLSYAMTPTKGVRMFFRANPFWLWNNATIALNGSVNKGTVSTGVGQLLYCNAGCAAGSTNGWNIVANPYPSSINWASPNITLTNVNPTLYIWRHDIIGYSTYNRNTLSGTNGGSNVIAAQQAFFVEAIASSASITFNETAKVSTNNATLRQGVATPVTDRLRVQLTRNGSNWEADEALLQFHNDATRGYDNFYDSRKMDGGRYNVSFVPATGVDLVINTMNYPTTTDRVALRVNASIAGSHRLTFADLGTVPAGYDMFIQDNYMGVLQNLLVTPEYDFDITADPASQGSGRFEIVYAPNTITGIDKVAPARGISVFPNPAVGKANLTLALNGLGDGKAQIRIIDALGRIVSNSQVEISGLHTLTPLNTRLGNGIYTVICESQGNTYTTRLVIKD